MINLDSKYDLLYVLLGAILQQNNARPHTTGVSQDFPTTTLGSCMAGQLP